MATEGNVEILYGKMYATKDFYQGEPINIPLGTLFNGSSDPNVAVRGGRVIAFKCITSGDEITMDGVKQL